MSVIQELNIRPRATARIMKQDNQAQSIELLIKDLNNPFYTSIAMSVKKYANKKGYLLFISSSENHNDYSMKQEDYPTAIICFNDQQALRVLAAIKDMNIKVPEDISVIGNDDIYFAKLYPIPLTTIHEVNQCGVEPFYDTIKTKPVARIRSDASGFYQISLDTGIYSFFVKENSLFYANSFNSDGCIQSAQVFPDSVTHLHINITYNATF